MKKNKFLWLLFRQKSKSHSSLGFSLIEQIVTLIIGSLITLGLTALVTELIQSDQTEAAFLATEKDTQIALDYITEDLREAVFVYEEISQLLQDSLPNFKAIPELGANAEPVLMFWKTEPIPEDQIPTTCDQKDELKQEECRLLQIKRAQYTLVVYIQATDPDPEEKWTGKSRIVRYALPKYRDATQLDESKGFVDPAIYNNFPTWPEDKNGTNQQKEKPNPALDGEPKPVVLADFIDIPNRSEFYSQSNPYLPQDPEDCPDNYARVPSSEPNFNSFYTCVRRTGDLTKPPAEYEQRIGANQDIIVYLRGNAENRDNLIKTRDHIPNLRAQVTLRGVIDKFGK